MNKPSSYIKYMSDIQSRPEKQVIRELIAWTLWTIVKTRKLKVIHMLGMPGNEMREVFYLIKFFNKHLPSVVLEYTAVEILPEHVAEMKSRLANYNKYRNSLKTTQYVKDVDHVIRIKQGDINNSVDREFLQNERAIDLFWADHFTVPRGEEATLIKRMSESRLFRPHAVVIMTTSEGHKHTTEFPKIRKNLIKYCSIPKSSTNPFLLVKYYQMVVVGVENGTHTLDSITGRIKVPKNKDMNYEN